MFLFDENVSVSHAADGWAKVKKGNSNDTDEDSIAELVKAEQFAEANELGVWTKDPSEIARGFRSTPLDFSAKSFFDSKRGTPVPGVVEAVLNGGCLRVALLTDSVDSRHATVTVHTAGIQAPSMGRKKEGDDGEPTPEPFAREAKHFTEVRLLNRDVHVVFEGEDKFKNLYCTIRAVPGATIATEVTEDVAESLAKNGLAKVVDWSAALMTSGAQRLRAAEKVAKQHRLRLWRDYTPPVPSINPNSAQRDFDAVVVEANSGDVLIVADLRTGIERKVHLASIRAPRVGNEKRGQKSEPWAVEAKEFLRKRTVGKKCRVRMEYARKVGGEQGGVGATGTTAGTQGSPAQDARVLEFGTVMLPNDDDSSGTPSDAGELLVLRGLAQCIKHRGEEERSSRYDELIAAEKRAVISKKGLTNPSKDAPNHHVNDIAGNAGKAKQFLPFLQRAGRSHGIVEYVVAGHRFKVSIPKEGAVVSFALGGVRCPQLPRQGEAPASPAVIQDAHASHFFARRHVNQREVEIEVDAVDKMGTFLGNLFVTDSNGSKVEVGEWLLREGLGSLHPSYTPDRHQNGQRLVQAMGAAQRARVGIWRDWSPEVEAAKAASSAAAAELRANQHAAATGPLETAVLTLTEVVDGGRFFAQRASDSDRVAWVHARLNDEPAGDAQANFRGKRGSTIAAKFTGDDCWYRAIVAEQAKGSDPLGLLAVHYGDFGNFERLPASRTRPIDPSLSFAQVPPLAKLCQLAHIKAPSILKDYGSDAAARLGDLAGGRPTPSRVERKFSSPDKPWDSSAQPEWLVTLGVYPREGEDANEDGELNEDANDSSHPRQPSVNETLVTEGLARVERSVTNTVLTQAQETARRDRNGMWEYGDVDSDDEEPSAAKPGAWGRRR